MFILRVIFVFLMFAFPLLGEEMPHLMLYFDINKTLIASDKAGNKSVEDVLNELLAEKYAACWDQSIQEPITFDAYVHEILVPGSRDDRSLREERKSYLHHFLNYLYEHSHPLYGSVLQDYEAAKKVLRASEGLVFPSFYRLLDALDQEGISYSIILRSFGEEVMEVKDEISAVHKKMFNGVGKFHQGELHLEEGSLLGDPQTIYQHLRSIEHAAIQDDWSFWNAHGMAAQQGKPFYIDREDNETLSIFFDDNIRADHPIKNIIAPLDAATGESIPIKELIESGQAVRVETFEAIVNEDYFKNRIEEAIQKHSGITQEESYSVCVQGVANFVPVQWYSVKRW